MSDERKPFKFVVDAVTEDREVVVTYETGPGGRVVYVSLLADARQRTAHVEETLDLGHGVVVDLDGRGRLVGVEIL